MEKPEPQPNPPEATEDSTDPRDRALRFLLSVWKDELRNCPICGSDNWGISEIAILPLREGTDPSSGVFQSNRVFPLVPINCRVCGYTFFFNEKWARAEGPPKEDDQ